MFYRKFSYTVFTRERNMDIAKIVGQNLQSARKLKGVSQKEIAKELNKYQSDYSQYETGKIQLDYEKIVYLCKRFDITPNELFDLDEDM